MSVDFAPPQGASAALFAIPTHGCFIRRGLLKKFNAWA